METNTAEQGKVVDIWNHIQKVHQIVYRELQKNFYDKGITPTQFEVLIELRKHKELPMWKISDLLSVTGGNVTGLIDRMEKKGLVLRKRSDKDRRIINAKITGLGEKMYNDVVGDFEKHLGTILSEIQNKEFAEFDSMLKKLYVGLNDKYCQEEILN